MGAQKLPDVVANSKPSTEVLKNLKAGSNPQANAVPPTSSKQKLEFGWMRTCKITTLSIAILTSAVVPSLVYFALRPTHFEGHPYFQGLSNIIDFSAWYKAVLLQICGVIALGITFVALKKLQLQTMQKLFFTAMAAYFVFGLAGALISPYKMISIFGFVDLYEGLTVIASYLLIAFSISCFLKSPSQRSTVLRATMFSALLIGTIGWCQFFGYFLFDSQEIQNLLNPYQPEIKKLNFLWGKGA